ncbi:ABC-2 type transport system permease protein [Flexibacter flexilis DSM 6793]|uniref:ABC-2 type transport system permease protein n=2 Tax=Flexibacter flexilis TaxID=998 RepID=A0A1I1L6J1_9BACT|nr:ABC-2 type transport system permease protein [Flexibacter flexilis DSM 6793]
MTLLGPLLFAGLTAIVGWVTITLITSENKVVEVFDESGLFAGKFPSTHNIEFVEASSKNLTTDKSNLKEKDRYALLYIPAGVSPDNTKGITIFYENSPNFYIETRIKDIIEKELENIRMREVGIDPTLIAQMKVNIDLNTKTLDKESKEKESSTEAAMGAGYVGAFLIYMFIFMYGVQVLKGVQEEKTNRIVEVMISSVKPFQLMMGKILGIAAVGLTQFGLWMLLSYVFSSGVVMAMASQIDVLAILNTINMPLVLFGFLFYFISGYLLYSALFAAIGAAVDNDTDSQQFMFPITIPLVIAFASTQLILRDTNSALAIWLSVIPFTAPIVMMVRIPFDPPAWQIAVSMLSMILGFLSTTWLAARIYRVGILMYGKKVNYKELAKWLFYKNL